MSLDLLMAVVAALLLDYYLGEPRRYHPLVAFGRLANVIEHRCQSLFLAEAITETATETTTAADTKTASAVQHQKISLGVLAWLLLVPTPALLLGLLLLWLPAALQVLLEIAILYFTIGLRSLEEHAMAVVKPLKAGDLLCARQQVARIVSRDSQQLSEQGVVNASVETVLENGSDGVLAPIFWFVLLGAPAALLYRFANTLDAMWGYRNQRYQHFGWAAARADDLLNWLPARLTALSYGLVGDFLPAISCMKYQGCQTDSPNAGRVMAAGAGALGVVVGGATSHHHKRHWRPTMGQGVTAAIVHIEGALALLQRALLLWLSVLALLVAVVAIT